MHIKAVAVVAVLGLVTPAIALPATTGVMLYQFTKLVHRMRQEQINRKNRLNTLANSSSIPLP